MRRRTWLLAAVVLALVLVLALGLLSRPRGPRVTVQRPTVAMADGVRLAVDVVLPEPLPTRRLPAVLLQTRYWRSFALKVPEPRGEVPPGPREPIVERLVEAGFVVVVADVRGTGASGGHWPRPWSEAEVADMANLLGWVAAQPWSDGRVGTTGLSYEGTTALLAATAGNPALRAVLAREVEWDLTDELLAPGGVRNLAFPRAWAESVSALDANRVPPLFPAGSAFLLAGVHPVDGDPEGAALAALVAARQPVDVAALVAQVRAPGDPFGPGGPPASAVGPSAHVDALARSSAAIGLWGGWWDGATGDAVLRAAAALPLAEAVVGPWTHEGTASASPFPGGERATVDLAEVVAFFRRHLGDEPPGPPRRRWYVAGLERWREGPHFPTAGARRFWLAPGQHLTEQPEPLEASLEVDFAATTGAENRWMTGMLKPVVTGDRRDARGLTSWTSAPLAAPLSAFGSGVLRCNVAPAAGEAALHVYLEASVGGPEVRLLTEGVARVRGEGELEVRLRALAFELPAGATLRVSLAGADADTFERVPAEGPQRLTLSGECTLTVPEVVPDVP